MSESIPTQEQLRAWREQWHAIGRALYRELIGSYTPEQQQLVKRINRVTYQEKLCAERARYPRGKTGKHVGLLSWPEEPPESTER